MFKKITALVEENRDAIVLKSVALAGITVGLIGSSILNKLNRKTTIIITETSTETVDAPEPEAPKAEEN